MPTPSPTYCVDATTNLAPFDSQGDITLTVYTVGGLSQTFSGNSAPLGSTVMTKCFDTRVEKVDIQGPSSDSWGGTISVMDMGVQQNLYCVGCDDGGDLGVTSNIVVDGGNNSGGQGATRCFGGRTCSLLVGGVGCLKVKTGASNFLGIQTGNQQGHLDLTVLTASGATETFSGFYAQGSVVVDKCYGEEVI